MNHIIPKKQNSTLATQSQQLIALGKSHRWQFKVLGKAPVPTEAIRVDNWVVVPSQEDTSEIPIRAMKKVQAVYQAGIQPKAWVVVHEAPMTLPKTTDPTQQKKDPPVLPYLLALGGLGIWLASTLITTVAVVDPILIAITPENDWIEIDRWA